MKCWLQFAALAALAVAFLSNVAGQDVKKDDAAALKKDAPKKDDAKKDEAKKDDAKKDDAKKDDAKKDDSKKGDEKDKKKEAKKSEPPEELPSYSEKIVAKLKRVDANSTRDFAIEISVVDPQKAANLEIWRAQQLAAIAQDTHPVNRANRLNQLLQIDYPRKKATEIYTVKDVEMRAPMGCKFRSLYPPVEYDDNGKQKKLTAKELAARRGNTKLPGYPIEFDGLRPGQGVHVYLAKKSTSTGKGKKKNDDDDPVMPRPEAVLIVVVLEPTPPR